MNIGRWLVPLLCCSLLVTSCTTLHDVPLPQDSATALAKAVKVGDTVIITLRDGSQHRVKVTRIDTTALSGRTSRGGEETPYAFSEMASIDVRRVSFWKTTGAVGATALVIGTAAFVSLLNALDDSD